MKYADVVATYDYYTLEQARTILQQEKRNKLKKQRIQFVKNVKDTMILFACVLIPTVAMILHWIAFGY